MPHFERGFNGKINGSRSGGAIGRGKRKPDATGVSVEAAAPCHVRRLVPPFTSSIALFLFDPNALSEKLCSTLRQSIFSNSNVSAINLHAKPFNRYMKENSRRQR
jgi:hypothetical protein